MKFFYSSGVKGYGLTDRLWHNYYKFPALPVVTKTITLQKKIGIPFAIMRFGNTLWNKVSLHNCGFYNWYTKYYKKKLFKNGIISIAGSDADIYIMVEMLNKIDIYGIELNFSCPNVKSYNNSYIPKTHHNLYLKLNHLQDPYKFDLSRIKAIRVNSIPTKFGGLSGKYAQKENWKFIEKFNKEGLNISGASCLTFGDFKRMEDIGCSEIGLGSITLINPKNIGFLSNFYHN